MKHAALALTLALFASAAHSAPPSAQQIDRLLEVTDMPRMVDSIFAQMDDATRQMAQGLVGGSADRAARERLDHVLEKQRALVRTELTWARLAPIYRRVYADLFTAEEIEAMTAFYSTPTGRSILQKTPRAMGLAMQEMQPIMQSLMQRMGEDMKQEFEGVPDRR